jgi:TPR repeat protein
MKTDEEIEKDNMERVKANDPVAICGLAKQRYREGDHEEALEYWTKAAALGDIESHFSLSLMYIKGGGVEKDEKKKLYHLEEAAIGGHPSARYYLGLEEGRGGRHDRAVKHFIIAANLGEDKALDAVKQGFQRGLVSKDDYAAALRGHHAAVNETNSEQRNAAEEWYNMWS